MIFAALEKGDWFLWEAPHKKENSIYAIKVEYMETEEYVISAICLKTGTPLHFTSTDKVIKIKKLCLDNFVDI